MIDKTRHLHIFNLVRTFDQKFSNPCPVTAWNQLWPASPHLQSPPPNPLSHFVCCHCATCKGSQHACTWQPASTQARITAICWPTWWWWDLGILTRSPYARNSLCQLRPGIRDALRLQARPRVLPHRARNPPFLVLARQWLSAGQCQCFLENKNTLIEIFQGFLLR